MTMGAAVRWRRYGRDRLYVTAADGTKLGHRDLLTGEDHLAEVTRGAEFLSIATTWLTTQSPSPAPRAPALTVSEAVAPAGAAVPEQRSAPLREQPVHEQPLEAAVEAAVGAGPASWEDLAQRRAGAMARQQAVALKEAAPLRTFVARILGVHTDERAWRIGADGEEKVAAQLDRLARKDPRFHFLHAIPVGQKGSDIDHLVIGPGGVFTLNAKHHPGSKVWVGGNTLMVNGQRRPYIGNAEAARASRLLTAACAFPVPVTGLVVPVGADDITIKAAPDDVHVVNRMRLSRWLRDRPALLTTPQIESIFDAARRSTTWKPFAEPTGGAPLR